MRAGGLRAPIYRAAVIAHQLLRHRTTSRPSLNPIRSIREECGPKTLTAAACAPHGQARAVGRKPSCAERGQSLGLLFEQVRSRQSLERGQVDGFLERPSRRSPNQTDLGHLFPSDSAYSEKKTPGRLLKYKGTSSWLTPHRGALLGTARPPGARLIACTD